MPGLFTSAGSLKRLTQGAIAVIAMGMLALSLSVNYAASVGFFLLAVIGLGIGIVRGFTRDLSPGEKWLFAAFAVLPLVALLTYMSGVETNIGFRMLGRLGRVLLFFPVFIAVRWARPRRDVLGAALAVGAILAFVVGIIGLSGGGGLHLALENYRAGVFPQGQAADHITFGDLALIQGAVGLALLLAPVRSKWSRYLVLLGVLGAGAGLVTSIISGARGGWLAIPILGFLLFWHYRGRLRTPKTWIPLVSLLVLLVVLSGVLGRGLIGRIETAWQGVPSAMSAARSGLLQRKERLALCPNSSVVLSSIVRHAGNQGVNVRVLKGGAAWHRMGKISCLGESFLALHYRSGLGTIRLNRNGESNTYQGAALYAQGKFAWRIAGGSWKQENLPATRIVTLMERIPGPVLSPVEIRVLPGENVRLVPVQLQPGSYLDYWANTSTGARLAMWSVAWKVFLDHPGRGAGYGSFRALVRERIAAGEAPAAIAYYQHPHSDYLNVLYGSGLLGLFSLLALLLAAPWALSRMRCLPGKGADVTQLRLAFWLLFAGIAISALTESLFIHSFTLSWYGVLLASILGVASTVRSCSFAGKRTGISSGGKYNYLLTIRRWWQYRDLLRNLVEKEIKVRYQGAFLGFAWSLMNPLLLSVTYFVVFTIVFKSTMKNYALYMVAGIIHWNLFGVVAAQASDILVENKNLIKKIVFPRVLVPASNLLVNLTLWLMGLVILLILLVPLGGHFSLVLLSYPLFLMLYLVFLFGIQMILSVLYVDFRDLKHLVEVLLMILFWSAPVVYPITRLPAVIRPWLELSPFTEFIMIFESLIYSGHLPPWHLVAYFVTWAGISLGIGSWLFLKRGKWVVERL